MVNTTDFCYRNYSLQPRNGNLILTKDTLEDLANVKEGDSARARLIYVTEERWGYHPFGPKAPLPKEVPRSLFAHLQEGDTKKVPLATATKINDNTIFLEVLDSWFSDSVVKMITGAESKYRLI